VYQIAVSFTVEPQHRDDFIRVALQTKRDALANEPGTRAFDLIADEENPNLFYLSETYDDAAVFQAHAGGPYFGTFFAAASPYATGPNWLIKGNHVSAG